MNTLLTAISLLGGLAMFLYGMEIMGDGLNQSSGTALKTFLGKLTHIADTFFGLNGIFLAGKHDFDLVHKTPLFVGSFRFFQYIALFLFCKDEKAPTRG